MVAMAKDKKQTKSETLAIRIDAKTRFALEFMARHRGQPLTTAAERAIMAAANAEQLPHGKAAINWSFFWDVSEGVRALRIAEFPEMFPTFEEARRLAFAVEHWPFFYSSPKRETCLNHYIDIIWPRIDEFVQFHEDMKSKDFFAAGKALQEAIRDAKLLPPDWPHKDSALKPAPEKPKQQTSSE